MSWTKTKAGLVQLIAWQPLRQTDSTMTAGVTASIANGTTALMRRRRTPESAPALCTSRISRQSTSLQRNHGVPAVEMSTYGIPAAPSAAPQRNHGVVAVETWAWNDSRALPRFLPQLTYGAVAVETWPSAIRPSSIDSPQRNHGAVAVERWITTWEYVRNKVPQWNHGAVAVESGDR